MVSDAGAVLERYEYDAYGKRTVLDVDFVAKAPGSGYTNIGFTGQRIDILDSGNLAMNYYKNRWYDTETGRFMSHDPLGIVPDGFMNRFNPIGQYKDGINIYGYVKNGPIINVDKYGLVTYSPIGAGSGYRIDSNTCRGSRERSNLVGNPIEGLDNYIAPGGRADDLTYTEDLMSEMANSSAVSRYIENDILPHLFSIAQEKAICGMGTIVSDSGNSRVYNGMELLLDSLNVANTVGSFDFNVTVYEYISCTNKGIFCCKCGCLCIMYVVAEIKIENNYNFGGGNNIGFAGLESVGEPYDISGEYSKQYPSQLFCKPD